MPDALNTLGAAFQQGTPAYEDAINLKNDLAKLSGAAMFSASSEQVANQLKSVTNDVNSLVRDMLLPKVPSPNADQAQNVWQGLSGIGGDKMAQLMDEIFVVMLESKQNQKQERTEAYRAAVTQEIAAAAKAESDQKAQASETFSASLASAIGQIASGVIELRATAGAAKAMTESPVTLNGTYEAGTGVPNPATVKPMAPMDSGIELDRLPPSGGVPKAFELDGKGASSGLSTNIKTKGDLEKAQQALEKQQARQQNIANIQLQKGQAQGGVVSGFLGLISAGYKREADNLNLAITADQLQQSLATNQASQDYDASRDAQSGFDDILSKMSAIVQSREQATSQIMERG